MKPFQLAQQKLLTAYWVPNTKEPLRVPDLTGHGFHALYSGGAGGAQGIADLPPQVRILGSGAATGVIAASTGLIWTTHIFAQAKAVATYIYNFGLTANSWKLLQLQPTSQRGYIVTSGGGNFIGGASIGAVEGSWHSIAEVSTGTQVKIYVDGVLKATSNLVPTLEANPIVNLGLNFGGTLGVGLFYLGTALSDAEVAKNHNTLRLKHGYP